ncbi:MBL fold metallo-hydrolase [Halobacteriaceae archaeon GCM10025711]
MTRPDSQVSTRMPSVAPSALKSRIDDGEAVTVLDVRTPDQFQDWHIDGERVDARNVPFGRFQGGDLPDSVDSLDEDEEVFVVCASGNTSQSVTRYLSQQGYDAVNVDGGMTGWALVYEATEIDADVDATVLQYQRPSSGCMSYLVVDGGEAAVVDPLRAFTDRYVEDAAEYDADLTYALDTHVHADHVSGVRSVAGEADADAVVPEPAAERGIDYDRDYATVEDGDELAVGDTTIEVIHTPGHTTGMTSYRVGDVLFTGDGLFTESVARPDLEDGEEGAPDAARMLYDSLQDRVLSLPDDTIVAPAHFSDAADPAEDGTFTSTLGDLQASMDALDMDREAFVDYVLEDIPPRPSNYRRIIDTNLGQYRPTDNEAFTLELGPNNCAASRDAMTSDD